MGPKYEFIGETMKWDIHILHRIRRLSDNKVGGWIESEENLSQDGSCWVDDNAKVYGGAKVSGNAQVYDTARVCSNARVYNNAKVYGKAYVELRSKVYGNAKVYDEANIFNDANVYGNAEVYGHSSVSNAKVYGNAKVCCYTYYGVFGNAIVHGNVELYYNTAIANGEYITGKFSCKEDLLKYNESKNNETKKVVQDFIYKVNDSNRLTTRTEYDSADEFFSEPVKNDIKLDTLVICAVDTKEPLIKLQKVETENKTKFKFIVDIINEDGDNFMFKSIIKSHEQLNQLIQQTAEALKQYSEFSKYADDLEEYL